MHGGADATGQSAMANDAAAPTHRRRNPGESLRGGPTLREPAIPPVAVGHWSATLLVKQPDQDRDDALTTDLRAMRDGTQNNVQHVGDLSVYW